jgi:glycosyltransferase involved in cell wall biosynthesis
MNTGMAPRFSVIIPLFNKRAYFARTLDGLLRQDFADFEAVIVDDGSVDGSAELVDAHPDPRIRVFRQANAGPGPARNTAARHARGEWLALLDADDLWAPDHLSTLDRIIRTVPDVGFISTKALWITAARLDPAMVLPRRGTIRRMEYFKDRGEVWGTASSVAVRRAPFLATGGFGSFCPGEDMDLYARLALEVPFAVCDDATAIYLRGNDGIMDRGERAQRGVRETGARRISPVETTLVRALADPRHAAHHAGIRDYLDRLKLRDARICLYRGDHVQARAQLAALSRPRLAHSWMYRLLAALPSSLVGWSVTRYSLVKRARAARARPAPNAVGRR